MPRQHDDDDDIPSTRRKRASSRDEDEDDGGYGLRDTDPDDFAVERESSPRQRKRRADDEDEDRPRRGRSRADDDEDEDRPRRRRTKKSRGLNKTLLWLCVGGGVFLVGIVIIVIMVMARKNDPLYPHMETYARENLNGSAPAGTAPRPKFLVVNMKDKWKDSMHSLVPSDKRASKPEEVGTVVRVLWEEQRAGQYTNGAEAYRHVCNITVYDFQSKRILQQRTIQGSDPPQQVQSRAGAKHYGSKPTREAEDFVRLLVQGG